MRLPYLAPMEAAGREPRQVTAIRKLAYLLHPYYFSNPPDSVSPWELGKIDAAYLPPAPLR
ncbi:MAG TPA: hypothetical protein VN363_04105 [Anaerolineales bacterium]|nr:hypothetical protein [Anaerolineales bacterium]